MPLLSLPELRELGRTAYGTRLRTKTAGAILNESAAYPVETKFDVFISHSYSDAQVDQTALLGLKTRLEAADLTAYVDWIIDPELDRSKVTSAHAERLRQRMLNSRSLFFATSENSSASKWMPWELGFADGRSGLVTIVPLVESKSPGEGYVGQEYLGLYPYVSWYTDTNGNWRFWVETDFWTYVTLSAWLTGRKPYYRKPE